ncbi:MAG: LytR/AlgR family response regulator transcription factor [Flavobacterium sp.]
MEQRYLILDDDSKNITKILSVMSGFPGFVFAGAASQFYSGIDLILEALPDLIFLEIQPEDPNSGLSVSLISECHRLLTHIPAFITYASSQDLALQALRYGAIDFLPKPFEATDFRRAWFRYAKERQIPVSPAPSVEPIRQEEEQVPVIEQHPNTNRSDSPQEVTPVSWEPVLQEIRSLKEALLQFSTQASAIPIDTADLSQQLSNTIKEALPDALTGELEHTLKQFRQLALSPENRERVPSASLGRNVICIKSYGDYRFLELNEMAYLKADNNSTDITLSNGELITAFKTLKYFEENLPENFYRIHNSYMVNRDYISRIHTGNSECYIKDSKVKVPFSKGYKEKVEQIIEFLAGSDFKEA